MKKQQINYKDQIVGYVESMKFDMGGLMEEVEIYLFDTSLKEEVIENVKRSLTMTFDRNPSIKNIDKCHLFQIETDGDKLIFKKI